VIASFTCLLRAVCSLPVEKEDGRGLPYSVEVVDACPAPCSGFVSGGLACISENHSAADAGSSLV
jgi:hypothetical protein